MTSKGSSDRSDRVQPIILVVEDDETARDAICLALSRNGFRTIERLRRQEVLEEVASGGCDAIVLDLALPGDDGVVIAAEIRAQSKIPILMLTGRSGIRDRVLGLEAGADDYLVKPFAGQELVARLRAILRRSGDTARSSAAAADVVVQIGDCRLEMIGRRLSGPNGSIPVTEREGRLLIAFCSAQGCLSRGAAYLALFQRPWDPLDRSLDVHVSNLRRKFKTVSGSSNVIATIRGEGYELCVPFLIEPKLERRT